ncbi:nitroreductase family deazaflavin-dependent oxidoreductase [Aquihabitans sp. McL0605]|uniref:nitroreductase family deazaflavin-dependent oxidoreductase n=1 Tax=Aquihabitans sp. McL0605 TaxID=3415671 RepID=UPI003CEF45A6
MASITGRAANFMSRRFPHLVAKGTHKQVAQFRESGGTKGNKMFGKPVFLLEVVGRKSGEPRPVMLMLVTRGDDLIVVGSNGGNPVTPNWYRNLMAADQTEVQVGADRWPTTAREVEGDEREQCWALAAEAYPDFDTYQQLTDRTIPVAVLERVPSA